MGDYYKVLIGLNALLIIGNVFFMFYFDQIWIVFTIIGLILILIILTKLYHNYKKDNYFRIGQIRDTAFKKDGHTYLWEISSDGLLTYVDEAIQDILGYHPDELIGKKYIWDLNSEEYIDVIKRDMLNRLNDNRTLVGFENIVQTKSGESVYVTSTVTPIFDETKKIIGYQGWDTNISYSKSLEKTLQDTEEKYKSLFHNMEEGLALFEVIQDNDGNVVDYKILEYNQNFHIFLDVENQTLENEKISNIFNTNDIAYLDKFEKVVRTKEPMVITRYFSKMKRHVRISLFSPKENQVAGVFTDITKEKDLMEIIEKLSYIDKPTGLHNRRYYEENYAFYAMQDKMPLSIIIADLNSLKLANDAFGHEMGDKVIAEAAMVLKEVAPDDALLARVGGDEFVMLCPNTTAEQGIQLINKAKELSLTTKVGSIVLSMSFGLGVMKTTNDNYESIFNVAESKLYSYKLKQSAEAKASIVDSIKTQLYDTYPEERKHAKNVAELTKQLALKKGLDSHEVNQAFEAGYYHDIGKIIFPNRILSGEASMSPDEHLNIQRHPEIGFRIISSMTDTAAYSDYILSHHENFDGSGYPRRLKADEIPLISRMIRITEAFDSMYYGRYKPSLSRHECIRHLTALKGKVFDPELTDLFIKDIINNEGI